MSKQIKLTIPQVPLSTNKKNSLSWTPYGQVQLQELKTLWVDEIWHAYRFNYPNKAPLLKKAKISIKIFFKTNAKRDADNYPCKEVIDAIKNNGLIKDDNYDVIGRPEIDITGRDKKHPKTEIIIVEVKKGG